MAEDDSETPPEPSADAPPLESEIGVYTCPHCAEVVAVDPDEPGPFIICPYCGGEFAIGPSEAESLEYESREEEKRSRDAELDGMRIRQLSTARRAAIRAWSYLVVGIIACATGGIQLILKTVQRVRYERVWDRRTFGFIAFAIAAFMMAYFFTVRAIAIRRELKQPLLDEPAEPPDFSTLGDGTQQAKNLEDMSDSPPS